MTDAATLLGIWQGLLVEGGLVFLRVGAAMALLPAFGERTVPVRVRLALALAFTALVMPAVGGALTPPDAPSGWLRLAGVEVVAGLALGIALRLMVLVLQIAGTIAANVVSLSQILGGASVDPQPAIGHILVLGGLALATMAGLHVKVAAYLILSYDLFAPGVGVPGPALADWGSFQVARAFGLAFALAGPFVLASVIYNLALGAINRAMPQLMVAFVGAPAITAFGLVLLAVSAPFLLALWLEAFDAVLAYPEGA